MVDDNVHRIARGDGVVAGGGLGVHEPEQVILVKHHLTHRDDGQMKHLHQRHVFRAANNSAVGRMGLQAASLFEEGGQAHGRSQAVRVRVVVGEDEGPLSGLGQSQEGLELVSGR